MYGKGLGMCSLAGTLGHLHQERNECDREGQRFGPRVQRLSASWRFAEPEEEFVSAERRGGFEQPA